MKTKYKHITNYVMLLNDLKYVFDTTTAISYWSTFKSIHISVMIS